MGLELIPSGGVKANELLEKLNAQKPSASPPPINPPPPQPRSNNIHDTAVAMSKDGSLFAIGKYNLLLLFKVGENWRIGRLIEDESQAQPGEYVTQLTILPLNKPQNTHCIIAGYSSGFIRLFGVTGVQYVAQKFHHGPVRRLVVCTGGMVEVGVMALYDGGVIASLTNFNLPDTTIPPPTLSSSDPSSQPGSTTISYRKWHLFGMENVNDLLFVSPYAGAPAAGRVVAAGKNPFLSFYTVTEEQNSSLRVAVALASTVASKLTSAVVSLAKNWWRGGAPDLEREREEKEKAKERERDIAANEIPVSLSVRWGIYDTHRQTNSILEAPNSNLAVSTDAFGRVCLVDTRACVIVRMWKGYRDAQCGWMVVVEKEKAEKGEGEEKEKETEKETEKEKEHNEETKPALFLVMYVPKRGLVEVWKMRHGSRVCAQSVGAGWRLVSVGDTCFFVDKNGLIHRLVLRE